MSNKERAMQLLEDIPENKLVFIVENAGKYKSLCRRRNRA